MGSGKKNPGKKAGVNGVVAVAIDKDKASEYAIRWAIANLVGHSCPIVLLHVIVDPSFTVGSSAIIPAASPGTSPNYQHVDKETRDLFLSFHCFCKRKDIRCLDVTLTDTDVAKAITEYVTYAAIENLVLGASKGVFMRKFKASDVPTNVSKGAPDFCNVYIVSKTKLSTMRTASRPVRYPSPLCSHLDNLSKEKNVIPFVDSTPRIIGERSCQKSCRIRDDWDVGRSVTLNEKPILNDIPEGATDISFVSSSDRTSIDQYSPRQYDFMDSRKPRTSNSSDRSFAQRTNGISPFRDFSFISQESGRTSVASSSASSQLGDEVESEMRRLKLELKQTMQMYSEACKEAVIAKERERQKEMELHRWRLEEGKRLEETGTPKEAATGVAERTKVNQTSEPEKERRKHEEIAKDESNYGGIRYRKYTIEEIEIATDHFSESLKVGEGGYGPVFKCYLDHTRVAVKVLRQDAAQGKTQFHQEVEVLSCIRHPHMVLLLGACPEHGCLVYEYMANGSLDDRLFCRGKTPALCWQVRFRIAAEVATGLHFLHQTKPEPLVHRDLKPANILLDRYFISKIGDVGLARLVPPSVADNITQYRMTSAAGTFCYIDPEYQQTGMLGVKSDVYSLGVVLLQLLTAKPPMSLAHQMNCSIEKGMFQEMLDPLVPDWPIEEALCLAKIAIRCAEMRRKDRPKLGEEVLPELNRLRDFADDRTPPSMFYVTTQSPSVHSQTSVSQEIEVANDSAIWHSNTSSTRAPSSTFSPKETLDEI